MFPSLNHSVIPGWQPDSLFSAPTPQGSGPCTKFKSGTEHPHVAALTRKIRMSPSNMELLLHGEQDSHGHLQVAKPSMRGLHGVGDMSASLPAPTSAPEGGATCLVPAHPHKDALGPSPSVFRPVRPVPREVSFPGQSLVFKGSHPRAKSRN